MKNLPKSIDLGRFYMVGDDNQCIDITPDNIQLSDEQSFAENVLGDGSVVINSMCSILKEIDSSLKASLTSTYPIVQNPSKDVEPKKFETDLDEQLSHFEYIFKEPHALLDRTAEKVNVAKVKRIPPKGYQHLASHTEDWLHRSFTTLYPRKILHEELILSYNVFENHILCSFVKRALRKIEAHIIDAELKEQFLEQCDEIFINTSENRGWKDKNNRNWMLVGKVYKQNADNSQLREMNAETIDLLNRLKKVLIGIRTTQMYEEVDQRLVQSVKWHDTNVLLDHKHYKYIKPLWNQLESIDSENTTAKRNENNQKSIKGLQSYVESLIVFVCSSTFASQELAIDNYEIKGDINNWSATHSFLPTISFKKMGNGVMQLKIGSRQGLRIVAIGNIPEFRGEVQDILISHSDLVLIGYDMSNKKKIAETNFVSVNPMDVDSVERVGKIIRSEILRDYIQKLNTMIQYDGMLKDYTKYINASFLKIDSETKSISIVGYPTEFNKSAILLSVENDESYRKLKKNRQIEIKSSISGLADKLDDLVDNFKNKICRCPHCGILLNKYSYSSSSYITCSNCGMSLIQDKDNEYEYKSSNFFTDIRVLGMDYIKFKA